jgi:hypothetical protein
LSHKKKEEGRRKKEEGSSATDFLTDLTDVKDRRKFRNGFFNGFSGCQEEGSSATDSVTDLTDVRKFGN